jgi:hypothetical protein
MIMMVENQQSVQKRCTLVLGDNIKNYILDTMCQL